MVSSVWGTQLYGSPVAMPADALATTRVGVIWSWTIQQQMSMWCEER
jgi:hypothetical protein